MPCKTVNVRTGGGTVPVLKCGQGEPVVLVHGLAGSNRWWSRNIDALSSRNTVYLLDLPGFGSMHRYAKQFSVVRAPSWLAQVLAGFDLPRASIVGHSMGALIAAMFATQYPERVNRLVLAAPAIALTHKSVLPFLLPMLRQSVNMNPAFLPTLIGDAGRAGPATILRVAHELLGIDMSKELAHINSPCLLLYGQRDPLVPPSLGPDLASKIRGSSLTVFPRAGHILMYDRADLFNKAVMDFLSQPSA